MKPCPKCGQETAEQFFRTVGRTQLCVLCAQRTADADVAFVETIADQKLHGGYGWLWKHIVTVIAFLIGYFLLRGIVSEALRALLGGS